MAAIPLAALVVISPFFFLGQASGHDFTFHLASWMEVARQWRLGVIYPHWAALANYGYGEARFLFYPPVSWLLGGALGLLLPWKMVPGTFIFIALLLAGLSMYRLALARIPPRSALAAAILYALNPYFLVIVYLRSDFAELLAGALFPLGVHYALNCFAEGNGALRTKWRNIAPFAVIYAVIWLTNPPAAVVASYALACLLLACSILERSVKPLFTAGASLGLGLGLASFYLVPAAFEQRWVNIAQVLTEGLRYDEGFLFSWTLDPDHNLFNLAVSAVAVLMIAIAGIGAVAYHRQLERGTGIHNTIGDTIDGTIDDTKTGDGGHSLKKAGDAARIVNARFMWKSLLTLGVASTVMMFPVSSVLWRYLPKLRFVQFPWRWLFVLAVSLAYLVAGVVWNDEGPATRLGRAGGHTRTARMVAAGALVTVLAGTGLALAADAWWYPEDVPVMLAAVQSGQGYEGTDEYCTRGGDQYDLPHDPALVSILPTGAQDVFDAQGPPAPGIVSIESWQPERKQFSVEAPQGLRVGLRLLNYPAWRVRLNGHAAVAESDSHTEQMILTLPRGSDHVEVSFSRTPDRTAGDGVSIAAVLVLAGLVAAGWRNDKRSAQRREDSIYE